VSVTCPSGHPSDSTDYCDVCGAPIGGAGGGGAGGGGGATAAPGPRPPSTSPLSLDAVQAPAGARTCPHCDSVNLPGALFCEVCGYDFTTGQLPVDPDSSADHPQPLAPPTPGDPTVSGGPGPLAPPAPLPTTPPPLPGSAPGGPVEWVVEVWVDPQWYDAQDVSDPMPSAGMPVVVPLTERSLLVGRTSASRNIHPQVDVSGDNGVSRRHAQLTGDGQRWFVEDLQSANGTYVGDSGAALPTTPLTPGIRHELDDDDRIYLGAWTRLVVRRATPAEQ